MNVIDGETSLEHFSSMETESQEVDIFRRVFFNQMGVKIALKII